MAEGDLDGDGRNELVLLADEGVFAFDVYRNEMVGSRNKRFGAEILEGMEVVDLYADGTAEVLVSESLNGKLLVLGWNSQSREFDTVSEYTPSQSIYDVEAADVDGDGNVEVFVLDAHEVIRLDSDLRLQSRYYPEALDITIEQTSNTRKNLLLTRSNYLMLVDGISGTEIWRSPQFLGPISEDSVQFVKLQGESRRRLAIGAQGTMYLTR